MGQRLPYIVKQFRGIDQHRAKSMLTPEFADDTRNVIVSSTGGLEKQKIPVAYTPAIGGIAAGPQEFYNFQQGTGLRLLLAHFGSKLITFDSNFAPTTVDDTPSNAGTRFSFVKSNNTGLLANGVRMLKITSNGALQNWGISSPINAPSVSTGPMFANLDISAISRLAGVVTVQTAVAHGLLATNPFFISPNILAPLTEVNGAFINVTGGLRGIGESTFDGVYKVATVPDATHFTYLQPGLNDIAAGAIVTGAVVIPSDRPTAITYTLGGATFRYSFKNNVDGTEGSASPASVTTGNGTFVVGLEGDIPTDPQVDTICWYGSLDAGGTWFLIAEVPFIRANGVHPAMAYGITTPLNLAVSAQFINDPPPVGKYLMKWNGRIIVINFVGGTKQLAYSGYEQILRGRPEQCFPPRNRIIFDVGADELTGGGAYDGGILIFSKGNRVFRVSGILEDITTSAPVIFTSFLQELSWDQGMLSHYSGASTPFGFAWLASDKTVQLYNGQGAPVCLSDGVEPILRNITVGAELNCIGCHFNYLKRDWYVLAIPTNGSIQPNVILIFDLKAQDNMGTFIFDRTLDWVGVVEDNQAAFHLCFSSGGQVYDLQVGSDTIGGLTPLDKVYSTAGILTAFWRGGYNGNETPHRFKFLRYGRIVTDQPGFTVDVKMIDDDQYTFLKPLSETHIPDSSGKYTISRAVKRWQTQINFPPLDASANCIELQYEYHMKASR